MSLRTTQIVDVVSHRLSGDPDHFLCHAVAITFAGISREGGDVSPSRVPVIRTSVRQFPPTGQIKVKLLLVDGAR